ncbi:hypothetical protein [Candidatus Palauibacter sp.]|uniref:hypothetical protein n=1 Tax=Candidatus Palauibacter sp. TaxID=3101350 RepID=UPI003B5A4337
MRKRRWSASTFLASEINGAADRFRAMIEAGRALVAEHTPVEMLDALEGSRLLSELANKPGTFWDGATGKAHANLLKDLYCLDAVTTVSLESQARPGSIDRGIVWQTVRLQGARYR